MNRTYTHAYTKSVTSVLGILLQRYQPTMLFIFFFFFYRLCVVGVLFLFPTHTQAGWIPASHDCNTYTTRSLARAVVLLFLPLFSLPQFLLSNFCRSQLLFFLLGERERAGPGKEGGPCVAAGRMGPQKEIVVKVEQMRSTAKKVSHTTRATKRKNAFNFSVCYIPPIFLFFPRFLWWLEEKKEKKKKEALCVYIFRLVISSSLSLHFVAQTP